MYHLGITEKLEEPLQGLWKIQEGKVVRLLEQMALFKEIGIGLV